MHAGVVQKNHHENTNGTHSLRLDPALAQALFDTQPPLFVVVHRDDADLLASSEGDWLRVLRQLDWRPLCPVAAEYCLVARERSDNRGQVPLDPGSQDRSTSQKLPPARHAPGRLPERDLPHGPR